MGKVLPSQRLLKQFEERLVFGEMNLSEIVRSGAQMMLQYALEREVTEALGRNYYENAPATTKEKGRRNGYESHRVLTGEGAVTVQVPQVRETEKVFQSKILDAYVSRTEKLDELIARMYVHGMSTRDIEATFADVLSGTGVSKSVVSRVTRCLSEDFEAFRKRDLSNEKLLYLELDGTYLRYHQGAERKEPILVATGYRADGTRVLLHIGVGNRESYENWKGFLQEMVARGMREPLLIVTDGNPGVLKAIAEVFPRSLKQRCQKHRLENILGKAPKEVRDELKAAILESFHANSYEQGLKKGREVIARYRQRFPSAMKCMEETLEACLQALRLPAAHHKRLRTSNLLERTFGEHKRRTKVIPHFFTEEGRCCTALAESEIRLWWWPRYVSSMKYPKRCQYKHAKQKKYHVRNWAEYNEGLRRRGDLTVWFDEEAIANWKADKTGKPGGQRVYSDMAIETGLVVRMVYKLAYRQTEGFLHSIASLLGLGIEIPDYSTLCRRSRLLRKKLRIPKAASTQPIHLMIDSTGLRIHVGNARKPPKQRAWRKLHIAVDRETGNIVASELMASRARDATRVPALLTQIQAPLVSVAADSAYDKEAVYEAIEAHSPGRRTRVVIPPQRNATLSQNSNTAMQERDRHIRAIERHGRREWYKLSGYTKRSMVENAVYRYKAIIGPEMRARTLARQRVEHRIGCEILNKMAALGMPDTYCAG